MEVLEFRKKWLNVFECYNLRMNSLSLKLNWNYNLTVVVENLINLLWCFFNFNVLWYRLFVLLASTQLDVLCSISIFQNLLLKVLEKCLECTSNAMYEPYLKPMLRCSFWISKHSAYYEQLWTILYVLLNSFNSCL